MTHSLAVLALSGLLTSNTGAEKPTWLTDYASARHLGRLVQKPLVVVVGSGQEGWEKLSQEGKLGKSVNELLAANYVCVYLNTADAYGQRLATAFELGQGPGLVISDRPGEVQAFSYQGTLTGEALAGQLRRFADGQRVARHTETAPVQRVSTSQPSYPQSFAPAYVVPAYSPSFGGSRSC